MTGSVNFSNFNWLVKSLDTNKNGNMDELRFDPEVQRAIDTDQNGQVSQQELVGALQADRVEINQGTVQRSKGFNIFVNGLETLKSVGATAENGRSNIHIWTPTMYSDDTARERYTKLLDSNQAYDKGIDQMENALRSIVQMTNGKTDSTSKALNIQARTTLESTQWRTFAARLQQNLSNTRVWFSDYKPGEKMATYSAPQGGSGTTANSQDPFANSNASHPSTGNNPSTNPFNGSNGNKPTSGQDYQQNPFNGSTSTPAPSQPIDPYAEKLSPYIREQEQINSSLQSSYATMNAALNAITQQCRDLPDLQASLSATNKTISQAFSNLNAIETSSKSGSQVANNIRKEADATDAKATGRTAPYAGIGAGVGAVAGAAIGYFAGGKNVKNAMIGAGVGAAASGGIGALIGHGIDSGYKGQASSLRDLAGRVESYNPANDKAQTIKTNQSLYNQLLNARDAHDLDRARVVDKDIDALRGQVSPIVDRSSEILNAYQKY